METKDSNRMIAEFMGGEYRHGFTSGYVTFDPVSFGGMTGSYGCLVRELRFHSSWDWLVPVIKKAMDFLQNMERPSKHHCCNGDLIEVDLICHMRECDLPNTYAKTVELVRWINEYTQSLSSKSEGRGTENK